MVFRPRYPICPCRLREPGAKSARVSASLYIQRFGLNRLLRNTVATTVTSTPTWRAGWVAGGGGQLRLWNSNWLARLEYLHYDFGQSRADFQGFYDSDFGGLETNVRVTSGRVTADVVRAGIDYKFD